MEETADLTAKLRTALDKLRVALAILDQEGASADIGAHLDLAACRLETFLVENRPDRAGGLRAVLIFKGQAAWRLPRSAPVSTRQAIAGCLTLLPQVVRVHARFRPSLYVVADSAARLPYEAPNRRAPQQESSHGKGTAKIEQGSAKAEEGEAEGKCFEPIAERRPTRA